MPYWRPFRSQRCLLHVIIFWSWASPFTTKVDVALHFETMTHSTHSESSIPIPAAGQSRTEDTIPSSSAVQETTLQSTEASLEATATEEEPTHTESVVHLGSKRHPESKHGHYVNSQPPKKQKKRVDLVKPEDDLLNAEYYFDNGKFQRLIARSIKQRE